MQEVSLASGIANLARARKLIARGTLSTSDISQCLIYLHAAAEALLRVYLSSSKAIPWKVRARAKASRDISFPDLVQLMAEFATPTFDFRETLLTLNALRNQAAHPHEGLVAIDVSKLETLLNAVDQLYATYADAIEREWRDAMLTSDEVLWVEVHSRSFKYYPSTQERRLVWIRHGTPLTVLSPGRHFPPLWPCVDQLAFVALAPRRLRCEFETNVLSKDRIPLTGEATLEVAIRDEESAIKRIILAATDEERLLRDAFLACLTAECVQQTYTELLTKHDLLSQTLARRCSEQLAAMESAFRFIGVSVLRVEAADPGLAKEALERARATERASTEHILLQQKRELQRQEAELEQEKAQQQHALETQRLEEQIDHTNRREELIRSELKLAALKRNEEGEIALRGAEIERKIKMEGIIATAAIGKELESDSARLAFFPKDVFELKKLEIQQEIEREKYKAEIEKYKGQVQEDAVRRAFDLVNQETRSILGWKAGQANAVLQMMAKREHITLEEAPGYLREGSPGPAAELGEADWTRDVAALMRCGQEITIRGDHVSVVFSETDKLEIQRNREGGPPTVRRVRPDGPSEVDLSWWSSGMTLLQIVVRLQASKDK
jgi:hypothetical protein